MKRYGRVARVRAEKVDEYKALHAAVWPEVLAALSAANIRNYTIFWRGELLFSYFEYVGDDYDADRAKLLACVAMQRWNTLTEPCTAPAEPGGQRWAVMDEIFHLA